MGNYNKLLLIFSAILCVCYYSLCTGLLIVTSGSSGLMDAIQGFGEMINNNINAKIIFVWYIITTALSTVLFFITLINYSKLYDKIIALKIISILLIVTDVLSVISPIAIYGKFILNTALIMMCFVPFHFLISFLVYKIGISKGQS